MSRRDLRALRDDAARAAAEGKHRRAAECYLQLEQLEPTEPSWSKRAAEMYRRLDRPREAIAAYERAVDRYAQGGFMVQAIAVCKLILQLDPNRDSAKRKLASITEQQDAGRSQAATMADRHSSLHGLPVVELLRSGAQPRVRPPTTGAPSAVRFSRPGIDVPALDEDGEPIVLDAGGGELSLDGGPATIDEALAPGLDGIGDGPEHGSLPEPPLEEERSSGSITIDRGAPLDSVDLAAVVPGAHPTYNERGHSSGIIVIPIDDEPSEPGATLEIQTFYVPPDDSEAAIEIEPDEEPEDLSIDDLEEVPLLAEPRPYSASARRALAATPLFASLSPAALESLIEHLALVDLVPGDQLFRQGDAGTTLYVVVEGEVAVISEGNPRIEVSRLGPGAFFGEVALVTEQPRSATIEATTVTQLLAIDRDVIATLVAEHADVLPVILRFLRERLVDRLVQTHPLFTPFALADRRLLVNRFKFLEIEPGTTIVQQGVHALGLYALLAGRVEVSVDGARVSQLGPGDLFGMMSLLTGRTSTKTVRTLPKCLALCLPAADFREVIMTHPTVLSYVGELAEERERELAMAMGSNPRAKLP